MAITYRRPQLPMDAKVHTVVAENLDGELLSPSTKVLLVHRGAEPKTVKFDGQDHVFQPGFNEAPYEVALHAQAHLIVPGSRNVETGGFESYIGIVDIDPPEMCEPFAASEVAEQATKVEAIDRTGQEDQFTTLRTSTARARMAGQGAGRRRPSIDGTVQATDAAREAAKYAMQPPTDGEAKQVSSGAREGEV